MGAEVLRVENLCTHFFTELGVIKAVDDVSFSVKAGEVLGLVGESGSGKSMTAYSIMGLIDSPGRVVDGTIMLRGENLLAQSDALWRRVRGRRIAMVFQDPMMTLNPVLRVDTQMIEAIRAHERTTKRQAYARAREALVKVGMASPDQRLRAYPHQLSGGMRQRVAIAIALLHKPDLIIADEPTTALDVTIQGQILFEMQTLVRESGMSLIWITHDLTVIAGLADTVCVMYAGKIVEQGSVRDVLQHPAHPYTEGLLRSVPGRCSRRSLLQPIPGMTPSLLDLPSGCAFRDRCGYVQSSCMTPPPVRTVTEIRRIVRCHYPRSDRSLVA